MGSGAFCPWRKRGDEGLIPPPPTPSSLPGEESEVKPRGLTAERGWLWELLLQHKEMDTKMLERPAMTLETERGKLPCF